MFAVLIVIILFLLLFVIVYVTRSFRKLSFLSKINNKLLPWCISLIPLIIIFCVFNFMNSVIILFHYAFFLLIVGLIMKILKKQNHDLLVLISIIVCALYMGYGAYQVYHVYETTYNINTTKNIEPLKIIQIADAHVGTTFDGKGLKKHIEKINKIDHDLFVITGDFIDDDTSYQDMRDACSALGMLKPKYGVYYVNGNHDKGYYNREYSYDDFLRELEKNNVNILVDETIEIANNIVLVGREDKQYARKSIQELVKDIDKSKYIIDLNHQPNDYDNEMNNVDLVLSGHTHGGQLFPLKYIGLLLNIDDEFYGLHKRENTNFIVTSGISDWAIDFKTGTFSEYVVININGE